MKLKYIIPVLAAVAAVSCQKADQEVDSNLDPNAVRIEATVGGVFPVVTRWKRERQVQYSKQTMWWR